MASADGWIAHVMSVRGSRPRMPPYWPGRCAGWIPALAPQPSSFRSRIDRTRSVPNSSKQPTWMPDSSRQVASIHPHQGRRDEVHREVRRPGAHGLRRLDPRRRWYVLDVREAFGVQQVVGDILGCDADAGDLDEPDTSRLRRWLGGNRLWAQSEEPAVPTSVNPPSNRRRLNGLVCWLRMETSLLDAGQCDMENAGL